MRTVRLRSSLPSLNVTLGGCENGAPIRPIAAAMHSAQGGFEGREASMAAADKRIAIRDTKTGEYGHAIDGHIPAGWVEAEGKSAKPEPKRK